MKNSRLPLISFLIAMFFIIAFSSCSRKVGCYSLITPTYKSETGNRISTTSAQGSGWNATKNIEANTSYCVSE